MNALEFNQVMHGGSLFPPKALNIFCDGVFKSVSFNPCSDLPNCLLWTFPNIRFVVVSLGIRNKITYRMSLLFNFKHPTPTKKKTVCVSLSCQ